jgi:isopentenyl diphosphate isomerase/L-lactate dehydrogenase-like FMN-dependent dehydrogenase
MKLASNSRRRFLEFLAASPLIAAAAEDGVALKSPKDALNVMDFEGAARKLLPPAHYGYLATGVDDDATLRANRDGYQRFQLRPRRITDVSGKPDVSVNLFGARFDSPIALCPVGSQNAFHPQGELAVARAAGAKKSLQILSTNTTHPIEKVAEAAGPIWYQLYATSSWEVCQKLVRHAESAGCPVLVLTVDLTVGRNTETLERSKRNDTRKCEMCHPPGAHYNRKPMFAGIDMKGVGIYQTAMTWEFVKRLQDSTKMKLVLKGIETGEDAQACVEHGVDGIIVSNHGGRAEESGRGTIECLPEVVAAVAGRIPVMIDGGVRRGGDVLKALALGARAVGIGRPYIWGLAAFGQPGVERVLEMLRVELELVMRQCGARSIEEIRRSMVMSKG